MSPKCLVAVVLSSSLFAVTLPAIQASLIHTSVSGYRSDASITTAVKSKMFNDSEFSPRGIDVETEQSVVYLEGQVAAPATKAAAERIARSCEGVRDVVNRLVIE